MDATPSFLAFEDRPVRRFEINGEPWWVLADVCAALGIAKITTKLEDYEKGLRNTETLGGSQELTQEKQFDD